VQPLLELRSISKDFLLGGIYSHLFHRTRTFPAVKEVELSVQRGEIVGLVGESGSGKSTLALIAVRLLAPTAGAVLFDGVDVAHATPRELRAFRRRVQMVFQDSNSSLNPRKNVQTVLEEALVLRGLTRPGWPAEIAELLELVGLGPYVLKRYPHQLSGGQRQRIGVTRALAMRPELLVADEPVSSLDVSLQAQIINLLTELRERLGLSMLFISHDLALVGFMCNRVAVMYRGRIVEEGLPNEVLRFPQHPYTQALIAAVPKGLAGRRHGQIAITVQEPGPRGGCEFALRCPKALPKCRQLYPDSTAVSATHRVSCHLVAN
jgi:oligopeptide/dipeptide ABC transporter ATP-binding protein